MILLQLGVQGVSMHTHENMFGVLKILTSMLKSIEYLYLT